jgi:tRNA dimethylallyltransferase
MAQRARPEPRHSNTMSATPTSAPQALALAGPTASGKTALALAFAASGAAGRPVEVISVDSALVYRGMDIGTAKPSAAERAALPHHLIDILDTREAYSAARFRADALRLVAEIRSRGHLPLLVGGTMLYLKALRDGLDAMPPADPAVRAAIDARAAVEGWPALHAELTRLDPASAARLAPGDAQRIQRALEVQAVSGLPLSAWQRGPRAGHGLPLALVTLEPRQRSWLHARIEQRFDAMVEAGLLAEVAALRARGDLHPDLPSMRCVGYRQAWAALACGLPVTETTASAPAWAALRADWRAQGIAATRQLAKRQLTWLRSFAERQVVHCDDAQATEQGLMALTQACRTLARD